MSGDDPVRGAAATARNAAGSAQSAERQVADSTAFRVLVSVGLVAYGVVHILIGWMALQIAGAGLGAGGDSGDEASQRGALAEIAEQPFGAVLLWAIAIGLFAMTLWQLMEAGWGTRPRAGPQADHEAHRLGGPPSPTPCSAWRPSASRSGTRSPRATPAGA